jgi:hypothetical protein
LSRPLPGRPRPQITRIRSTFRVPVWYSISDSSLRTSTRSGDEAATSSIVWAMVVTGIPSTIRRASPARRQRMTVARSEAHVRGVLTWMTDPENSANSRQCGAVTWLSAAPGPAYSTAVQSSASRLGAT